MNKMNEHPFESTHGNHHYHHSDDIPDAGKIKEILDVVSEKIPGLLKELSGVLYGPDSAKKYAQAAAIFYKELRAAGMDNQQAFELTQQYMSTLNLGKVMKGIGHD
jgi:hypothetical protein